MDFRPEGADARRCPRDTSPLLRSSEKMVQPKIPASQIQNKARGRLPNNHHGRNGCTDRGEEHVHRHRAYLDYCHPIPSQESSSSMDNRCKRRRTSHIRYSQALGGSNRILDRHRARGLRFTRTCLHHHGSHKTKRGKGQESQILRHMTLGHTPQCRSADHDNSFL
jgi:hypothetical protein